MNGGEIWEAGPPVQIFEYPQRPETYGFVFNARSWKWALTYPDGDHPAMEGSLAEFCSRQLVGKRLANACQHVVEELSAVRLPSIAREIGQAVRLPHKRSTFPKVARGLCLRLTAMVWWSMVRTPSSWAQDVMRSPMRLLVGGYATRVASNDPAVVVYEIE